MSEEQQQQPPENDASLAGAVDLANPIIEAIRRFGAQAAQSQAVGVVLISLDAGGNISILPVVPGGLYPTLGILDAARVLMSARLIASVTRQEPAPPETAPPIETQPSS